MQHFSSLLRTLSHSVSGNKWLPDRSKLLMVPTYFALDIVLSFHLRVTFRHHPRCYQPDSQPFRGPFFQSYPLSFVRTMEFPKKGCWLRHDDLKQRNEDINVMDRSLREEQPRTLAGISYPEVYPFTPPLKSQDEISCSGGELWRPGN